MSLFGKRGPIDKGRAVEVVAQADLLGAVGGDIALLDKATLNDRLELDVFAGINGAVLVGNQDVRAGLKESGSARLVARGIVAQDDLNQRHGLVLGHGQGTGKRVAH